MHFEDIKYFNFGVKKKPSSSICGFTRNVMWLIEGSTKLNQRGNLTTSDIALWWNNYFNIEFMNINSDIETVLNNGLELLKETQFNTVNLGISLAVVKVNEYNELELFLIGNCDILYGTDRELRGFLSDEHNNNLTDILVNKMVYHSNKFNISVLDSRSIIQDYLYMLIEGEKLSVSYNLVRSTDLLVNKSIIRKEVIKDTDINMISLVNSGVSRYYKLFKIGDKNDLFLKSININYIDIFNKLKQKELFDISCDIYPRIKKERCMALLSSRLERGK